MGYVMSNNSKIPSKRCKQTEKQTFFIHFSYIIYGNSPVLVKIVKYPKLINT